MIRVLLEYLVVFFVGRMLWRAIGGLIGGALESLSPRQAPPPSAPPSSAPPSTGGVAMARDPVCGTFVVPDRALSLADGRQRVYFCSAACRDAYQARTA